MSVAVVVRRRVVFGQVLPLVDMIRGSGKGHQRMNNHYERSAEWGTKDLGWLVRCKTGCEGIVNGSVPRIGDPCPLCTCEHEEKSSLTFCVRIATVSDADEQVTLEGSISLEGDVVQAWDVDLGSFTTGIHSEDSTLTIGNGTGELGGILIPLTAACESENSHIPDVQVPQEDKMREVISNAGEETSQSPEQEQHNIDTDDSTGSLDPCDGARFDRWHVLGLVCCAALLLIGGLLTFDIVRAIYSPTDTAIASPILRVLR